MGKLVDVGLLLEAGERGEGRRRETLYRTPGSPVLVQYDPDDPRKVELTSRYARNMLSRSRRLLERALESGAARTSGAARDTYVAEMTAWLSDKDLAAVNRLITQLHRRLRPAPRRKGTKLCRFALALTPVFPGEE